jgi:uncharacterized protein
MGHKAIFASYLNRMREITPPSSPYIRGGKVGLLLLSFLIYCLPLSAHAIDVPQLKGYVNDYADMISPPARTQLESELRAFEQTDSTQIAILTIPSLEGEPIEDFGIKVADTWKIGQKHKDNGIIFLVAKQDRKMRIEVGRGLEGRLTDLLSGRIIELVVKPRFKRGDFDGGFITGVQAMVDATRGEFKADDNNQKRNRNESFPILSVLLFGGIIILIFGSISRISGAVAGAVIFPGIVHLIMPGIVAAIVSAVLGVGVGLFLPALFSTGRGSHSGGGFWMGGPGLGGGFGGGGGFDSGGFSGGGGDFGGGGASGGW